MKYDQKNLEIMATAENYNKWIYNNIKGYLGKRILEVGCGIGNMTKFFLNRSLIVGTDINKEHLKSINHKFKNYKNFKALNLNIEKESGDLKKYKFDTVICINVLEHIKEDIQALKNMNNVLVEKGKLILFVPALQNIYGTIDESDHHYRRYNKKALIRKIKKAGFSIKKIYYMNFVSIFGWYYHGRILKRKTHPSSHISIFNKFINLISFFEKIVRPPVGLSLIAICKK